VQVLFLFYRETPTTALISCNSIVNKSIMQITRIGSKPSTKGPEDWFTGSVRIDSLFDPNEARRSASATVTFEPGARTAWHTHPLGQTLIITTGIGWVQKKDEEIVEVHPGDVVWFEPNEKHWHGGTATNGMSHIAIQENLNGKVVEWMEKVTDEEYYSLLEKQPVQ
jgi:quercetin dioxygenase-like cupin family protein